MILERNLSKAEFTLNRMNCWKAKEKSMLISSQVSSTLDKGSETT